VRLARQAEEVVDKLFHDGPPPHYMDAMQDLIPLLKNKIKISPQRDGASAEAMPRACRLGCVGCE
jgi:hypothetical protein